VYIDVNNLTVVLNKQTILNQVTFSVSQGQCVGLVGHNGSGKSVLLKALCGFVPIQSGEITVDQTSVINGKEFIKHAGIVIEQADMVNYLSAKENLSVLASIKKKISESDIDQTLDEVGLSDTKNKKFKNFSLGMKQRLRIAQAIMENPDILVLDEPFNGLDKSGVAEISTLLLAQKNQGKTIFLTSHDERHIEMLCDEVYELEEGKLCKK
jgi:ABC-2 type transport system ATP-binding protein